MRLQHGASMMLACVVIASCGRDTDYADQEKRLFAYVDEHRMGESADVWLEKLSIGMQWDRVALIFGYGDDYAACMDIAEALGKRFTAAQYRCSVASQRSD